MHLHMHTCTHTRTHTPARTPAHVHGHTASHIGAHAALLLHCLPIPACSGEPPCAQRAVALCPWGHVLGGHWVQPPPPAVALVAAGLPSAASACPCPYPHSRPREQAQCGNDPTHPPGNCSLGEEVTGPRGPAGVAHEQLPPPDPRVGGGTPHGAAGAGGSAAGVTAARSLAQQQVIVRLEPGPCLRPRPLGCRAGPGRAPAFLGPRLSLPELMGARGAHLPGSRIQTCALALLACCLLSSPFEQAGT